MRREGPIAAFSRIELVAVIFILILFGSIGVAFVGRSQQAKTAQCASNLRQLGVGVSQYTKENESRLPFAYIQYTECVSSRAKPPIISRVKTTHPLRRNTVLCSRRLAAHCGGERTQSESTTCDSDPASAGLVQA